MNGNDEKLSLNGIARILRAEQAAPKRPIADILSLSQTTSATTQISRGGELSFSDIDYWGYSEDLALGLRDPRERILRDVTNDGREKDFTRSTRTLSMGRRLMGKFRKHGKSSSFS